MAHPTAEHPDRLLPADPGVREIARSLFSGVEGLPIISPHGHVDAAVIEANTPFPDPAALLVTPDHYVTRLIHAGGVPMDQLGLGNQPAESRQVWRHFCAAWPAFEGTASGYWIRQEFAHVFGIGEEPSAENADQLYDALQAKLSEPGFRPRELFKEFNIEVLATTDDPLDSLDSHAALQADPPFPAASCPPSGRTST
jgi:glucuronate isomerase